MRTPISLLVISLFFASGIANACQFDTDCEVGSKCLKQSGQLDGMCVGGLNPGNRHDRTPYSNDLDINKTEGNTCSFDTDCGPGSKCMKGSGQIYGTCMRRR
jgi:hypothetical protein